MSASRSTIDQRSILGDASGLSNTRSASRSRRKSFSVSDRSSHQAETPSKSDRRALLEEWRNSRGAASATSTHASGIPTSAEVDTKKRTRIHDAPPLPPSASSSSSAFVAQDGGLSARERIRQRKQQKRLHHHEESPRVPIKSSIEYFDDDDEVGSGRRMTARSPLLRSSLGGARRRSFSTSARRGRGASPMLSQESEGKQLHQHGLGRPMTHIFL